MIVELKGYTPDPEQVLIEAFSECYQKPANIDVVKNHAKHKSVLEHVTFRFRIKISRVCLEHLVRHRMANFTVQSHRYTDILEEDCYWFIPSEVLDISEWIEDAITIHKIYKKWRDRGISKQSARYLAPKGVAIWLTFTMDLSSLLNFFSLRLDRHAQEEIQILAGDIYYLVMDKLPNLKENLDEMILRNCDPEDPTLFDEVKESAILPLIFEDLEEIFTEKD